MARKILVTGASGLIGGRLTALLLERGYEVAHLSRKAVEIPKVRTYLWDPDRGMIDEGCIERTEAIIHLAGAPVADKAWTAARKTEIIESRTASIELLYATLRKFKHDVKTVVSSGAIGFYGNRNDEILTEESPAGQGFLSESCVAWEAAVDEGKSQGLRVAQLRVGIVLSKNGGALAPLAQTVKLGLGSPLGNGKQWMSWIHLDDCCRLFIKALENESLTGVVNAVAPNPVRNEDFVKALAQVLKKPLIFPAVPRFALNALLGERSELVLDSARVSSEKLDSIGFEFQFKQLERALQDIYSYDK